MITLPPMGMMRKKISAPRYISQSSLIQGSGSSSLIVPAPAGIESGDLLLFTVWAGDLFSSPNISGAPSGWSFVTSTMGSLETTHHRLANYRKIAGASEPADYTWTWNSSTIDSRGAVILVYRPAHGTQLDAWAGGTGQVATATHTQSTITTNYALSTLVHVYAFNRVGSGSVGSVAAPPTGMTQRYLSDFSSVSQSDEGLLIYDQEGVAVGATGSKSVVMTNADLSSYQFRAAIRATGT